MLEVRNLQYSYSTDNEFSLNVPAWTCPEGARVAIVGRSGSGKTTFLKCLAGLLQPSRGEILWREERVKGAEERLVPGNDKIKLVQQDFGQDPHMKVVENLRKYILEHDDAERAQRIEKWLSELEISNLEQRRAKHLSGGQLQRVALAQTLLAEPEVLLMDEPFSNLDPVNKHEFIPALRNLFSKEKMTTIAVMHDPVDALRIADEIVVFQNGEIIESGSAEEIFRSPKNLETARLFGLISLLSEDQNASFFHKPLKKLPLDGKVWFRPNEVRIENIKANYVVQRTLPMPGFNWLEIEVEDKLIVVSE
ncbi:MAG: ABC transporter ATP-binding protein [Flavobacteriia bacterium]|nr:ABC transporter ATP-binding protein [Flavobacteriia bacterium]